MNNREDLEHIISELRDAWEIVAGTKPLIRKLGKANGVSAEGACDLLTRVCLDLTHLAVEIEINLGEEDK